MLDAFLQSTYELLEVLGLPLLFTIFVLKGSLIGKVFPTSVFLPGYVLATRATYWEAILIVVVVTVAHVLGQFVIYAGCRRYGRSFVSSIPYVDADPNSSRFQRFDDWFERYGGISIFVTNVIPWTRGLIAIPAGTGSYPIGRYTVHVTTSTFLYHGLYVALALLGVAVLS